MEAAASSASVSGATMGATRKMSDPGDSECGQFPWQFLATRAG